MAVVTLFIKLDYFGEHFMQAKLTLQLDPHLISQAKSYAKHHGKSLSQLVAEYFRSLANRPTFPSSGAAYRYEHPFESATPVEDWEVLK